MCDVMWSRFTTVTRQVPQAQVRLRLLVLLRPMWLSQTCSYRVKISSCLPLTWGRCQSRKASQHWAPCQRILPTDIETGCQSSAEVVDVGVGRADVLADEFDGFQGGGRLGLRLGSTFLAVERRKISSKSNVYDDIKTKSFTRL